MFLIPLIESFITAFQKLKKIDPVEILLDCVMMLVGACLLVVLVANS